MSFEINIPEVHYYKPTIYENLNSLVLENLSCPVKILASKNEFAYFYFPRSVLLNIKPLEDNGLKIYQNPNLEVNIDKEIIIYLPVGFNLIKIHNVDKLCMTEVYPNVVDIKIGSHQEVFVHGANFLVFQCYHSSQLTLEEVNTIHGYQSCETQVFIKNRADFASAGLINKLSIKLQCGSPFVNLEGIELKKQPNLKIEAVKIGKLELDVQCYSSVTCTATVDLMALRKSLEATLSLVGSFPKNYRCQLTSFN